MSRVIVIAPHPDDELIGCGGTLLLHKAKEDKVFVVYLTNGELYIHDKKKYIINSNIRKSEAMRVCEKAGFEFLYWSNIPARSLRENYCQIQKNLINIFQSLKPNFIYLPHVREKDADHVCSHDIAKEAYWLSRCIYDNNNINTVVATIYNYEVWSPLNMIHKCIDITDYISDKVELIQLYRSQIESIDYAKGVKGLNQYRAIYSGMSNGYAEVFCEEEM